jgi:hypothetical protein
MDDSRQPPRAHSWMAYYTGAQLTHHICTHCETKVPVAVLQIGPELFRFTTYSDWVNHAKARYGMCGVPVLKTICVDASGRICTSGKEMMSARDRGAFPCVIHHIDPEFAPGPKAVAHA